MRFELDLTDKEIEDFQIIIQTALDSWDFDGDNRTTEKLLKKLGKKLEQIQK